ncbi:MAG: GAF domain-containing sensor histidine kinase [Gemmatimonadota bacterium]
MNLLPTLLRISQATDPTEAFNSMVNELAGSLGLKSAVYVRGTDRRPRDIWPPETEYTDDLLDTALHVIRPEAFPLGSEFPFEASAFPECEMLFLPLHRRDGPRATCVLIGDAGSFGGDLAPWEQLVETLEAVERRHERLKTAEDSCEELRRRVEESEALHTLGLAANRTLDLEEVLNLVARFTRTLLGAQYVTVSTATGGDPETVASVGLRQTTVAEEDHHLARCVVEAEKPLMIGSDQAFQVESFPFHEREGMKVGVGLPLSLFGDTFGALIVGYRNATEVSSRDVRLALTLAGHAAVAIGNARLHERVEQRSNELEQAYDELNRVSAAKERFFASINHELRNPLSAILGYQTLLEDAVGTDLPEKARGYLKKANQSANTLRALINDLLDLSKIAAGRMPLDLQPCAVADFVGQALDTIRPLADSKGVTLTAPDLETLPSIVTDSQRVQQILVNLLSNAVKFSDGGEVRLEVRQGGSDSSDDGEAPARAGEIEFAVTDNGPGIAEADLTRVFEEFEQVEGTTGGTGLGLPISRRFARLLGGDLWAESTVGQGSTFVLRLVVDHVVAEEMPSEQASHVA